VVWEESSLPVSDWETSEHLELEEFTRAVTLGLFDYLKKARSRGFVISLSGGADSTACAMLVRLGLDRMIQELGFQRTVRRLGMGTVDDDAEIMGRLLTCCYQATRHSSETTRSAAEGVAEAIGACYFQLSVDALLEGYQDLISTAIQRPLSWDADDIALQNIQARVRGPSVWMLANLNNALLLATSNRSEAAVGYATMDGDTCGGLSPIAGIDKAFLRRWLVWLESHGPAGSHPWPALAAVNAQSPTAELRPAEALQTDEDDLMPYPVLDAIERSAIRDKRMPAEVYQELCARQPEVPATVHYDRVARFFRLWARNQWKRERYAPSFHVDDENLDPKTWCRFPILSGSFEAELKELHEAVLAGFGT
jgi:NAD+ synthase (glutamine-hydrolysing)